MEKQDPWRNQIMTRLAVLHHSETDDFVTRLWEPLKKQVGSLMGEEGFHALLMRSIFLSGHHYPWLSQSDSSSPYPSLSDLQMNFAQRELSDIRLANADLLFNFVDLLRSLIGEFFTTDILRSAWGSTPFDAVIQEQDE